MAYQRQITLSTPGHRGMHDLTDDAARIAAESHRR